MNAASVVAHPMCVILAIERKADMTLTGSAAGRRRKVDVFSERPLFVADWDDVLFLHFEVHPRDLQSAVPFELDLRDGRAYLSLVAFTQRRLRPAFGGRLARSLT